MYTVTLFDGYARVASASFKSDYHHRASAIADGFARGVASCTGYTVVYTERCARDVKPEFVTARKF